MSSKRLSSSLVFDLTALFCVAVGNALLAARLNLLPLALGLIGVACILRLTRVRARILMVPLQLPLLLFLVSAWIGVMVSFDPEHSLRKFVLILGGILLYYVVATTETELAKKAVAWGLVIVGVGVALYFLTQTDFSQEPLELQVLNQIGLGLYGIVPQAGFGTPHPNLIAGILLLSLPYAIGLGYNAWRNKRYGVAAVSVLIVLLLVFGMVMTTSRGAMLALVAFAAGSAYLYAAARVARRAGFGEGIGVAVAVNLVLILFLLGALVGGARIGAWFGSVLGNVGGVSRLVLYQQVFQLNQDYFFTGAGLDTFSPQFSTYELMIDVPFLPHAHNLALQVWFEQGILGIVAFGWITVAYYVWAARRRERMNWLAMVSIAATSLMLLHGLVDVLFYFSRVISLMFIPLGLTVCALEPFRPLETRLSRRVWIASAVTGVLLVLVIGGVLFTRRNSLIALWTANQGALAQAKIELTKIAVPRPTPREVRRESDLSPAERIFQEALLRDRMNRVANTRLGMIALDQIDFANAARYLSSAYEADHSNRPTIKALGLTYVWLGEFDNAEPLLKQIPEANRELREAVHPWKQLKRQDLAEKAELMAQRIK